MARDRASRPEARSLRLFVAFDVSTEAADAVAQAIEPWTAEFPRARWVPRENWHVTLKFLGQTWPRLEGWVRERVGEVAGARGPVSTHLNGLGSFPSRGRARVLWAGIDDEAGGLAGVATALDEALSGEFRPEARPFSPHLTVARSEPPIRLPEAFSTVLLEPVAFTVDRIVLFRSHLRRPAPRYERLAAFPLRAPLTGTGRP
jgi:RNA 2',3'-cyclic 3'-phosphodiesterase